MRASGWSAAELRALRRLARTHTKAEAAAALGRTLGQVNYVVKHTSIRFAKLGGAHASSRWPASVVAEAVRLRFEEGLSVRAVARRVGVSNNTVYGWVSGESRWVDTAGGGG